jgi:hypothetical protein
MIISASSSKTAPSGVTSETESVLRSANGRLR